MMMPIKCNPIKSTQWLALAFRRVTVSASSLVYPYYLLQALRQRVLVESKIRGILRESVNECLAINKIRPLPESVHLSTGGHVLENTEKFSCRSWFCVSNRSIVFLLALADTALVSFDARDHSFHYIDPWPRDMRAFMCLDNGTVFIERSSARNTAYT